jgi:nucleotide-binding universal stress UspA family protein
MSRILIPTDFSPVADNALKYAMDMATQYQLDITLAHVVQLTSTDVANVVYIDLMKEMTEHAEEKMLEKVMGLRTEYPHLNFDFNIQEGLFLDSLEAICNEIRPVAVIMGITGSGEGIDKLIGSNAILAMDNLSFPLVVIPKSGYFQSINKICFACDLKHVATSTPLLAIKVFAQLFNAEIHILNIDFQNRLFTAKTPNEIDVLNAMFDGIPHHFHYVENENIQEGLNDFISQNEMDMVIMLPKKHSWLEGLFRKSQTKEMLYHSQIPVLALKHS